jgi:hypothetical protein
VKLGRLKLTVGRGPRVLPDGLGVRERVRVGVGRGVKLGMGMEMLREGLPDGLGGGEKVGSGPDGIGMDGSPVGLGLPEGLPEGTSS